MKKNYYAYAQRIAICSMIAIASFIGCSLQRTAPEPARVAPPPAPEPTREETVSYYGKDFAGKKTASGEKFDPKEHTAAHRTLPFGSKLKVTNPKTGKSTVVRVNDRGPFVKGRNLDISAAAADAVGIKEEGVEKMLVEEVK